MSMLTDGMWSGHSCPPLSSSVLFLVLLCQVLLCRKINFNVKGSGQSLP